ncbi:unnamed protein product [Rhizophagus irregularis]|nr:unnamed protein product [Rhizophagus irregularis]
MNTSSTSKNHPINSGFAVTKLSASTPFSNGWRYLDGFWVDQFLKTAELQLDNEIFVFLKEKNVKARLYIYWQGIIEECEGKRKRNAAEEKENNLPQTKMKLSESNSCTESTELRFPDEIVNWAGFEQGVLALQPEVDKMVVLWKWVLPNKDIIVLYEQEKEVKKDHILKYGVCQHTIKLGFLKGNSESRGRRSWAIICIKYYYECINKSHIA